MARFEAVQVYLDLERFEQPIPMGLLHCQGGAGGEIFSFEYTRAWLERPEIFSFDPDLALVTGHQYPAPNRNSFGIFLDSSPDRWGRVLMQRRESMRARQEKRRPRALTEWDFLLGVHDETRLGALRFRASADSPFIDSAISNWSICYSHAARKRTLIANNCFAGCYSTSWSITQTIICAITAFSLMRRAFVSRLPMA